MVASFNVKTKFEVTLVTFSDQIYPSPRMAPKVSGKTAKKAGKAQKNIAKGEEEEAQEKGELRHLHLQSVEAGPPRAPTLASPPKP